MQSIENNYIYLEIFADGSFYAYIIVNNKEVKQCADIDSFSIGKGKSSNQCSVIEGDGIFLHYLLRTLSISNYYRHCFINKQCSNVELKVITYKLSPPQEEIIDHKWNFYVQMLVWNLCEMDNNLSWLSTLGGAFSSLGDKFKMCALMAAKISVDQMKIAIKIGDPSLMARCLLYLSLSYIQRNYLKTAKYIISTIHKKTKMELVEDIRLKNMCLGIWNKLQYEHKRRRLLKRES